MKYIIDEKIKKKISKIGFGGGRLGSTYSEENSFQLLDVFYQNGGTVLDTARSYSPWEHDGRGKSESCIGKWIEKNKVREKVVVVTKGGIKGNIIDNSRENLVRELNESLEALKTDYIDIYLLHKDDLRRSVEEIVETMQLLKEMASVKKIGVANMNFKRFYEAVSYAEKNHMEPFTTLQTWWSLAEYKKEMWNDEMTTHMESEMYQFLKEKNILCMAYTSQCKGYFQKMVLEETNITPFLKERIETKRNIKKAEYIKKYCKANNIHPTAFVNGYITSNALKGIALVGCSTVNQVQDIMNNCDYVLPQSAIDEIDKI